MSTIEPRRELAIKQIRKQRAFKISLMVYASVNAAIVAFWAVLAIGGWSNLVKISVLPNQGPLPAGFFWPIFPIVIWGAIEFLSWYSAYHGEHRSGQAG